VSSVVCLRARACLRASFVLQPILNLKTYTLNPQPSTLNPQPSTLNPQPSTLLETKTHVGWRQATLRAMERH